MSHEFKKLRVSSILLDQENPRFPSVANQREALHAILNEQGDKIYNLAYDIVQYNLDPSKRLIIFKEKSKYIDGDGNRRITALKILETPDLIKNHKFYAKFKKLSKGIITGKKIDEVECVVFQSRSSIRHWLEINHSGELDGRGQIPWSSEQKQRFKGAKTMGLVAKEKLLDKKLITEDQFDSVNVTTLTRLLNSKHGRAALSIKKENGNIIFHDLKALLCVYKNLIGKSVKEVYHEEDRKKFLSGVLGSKVGSVSRRTQRIKGEDRLIFGEALILKHGLVNNIYRDICEIYEKSKGTGRCVEILGFSMRLILDVAAREYFTKNPNPRLKKDDIYKEYIKLVKSQVAQKDKNTLSLDKSIKNIIEEENVVALLAKLAHGSVHANMQMVLNLSYIVGSILKIHFVKRSS